VLALYCHIENCWDTIGKAIDGSEFDDALAALSKLEAATGDHNEAE
jgi:hypothetical protein